MTDKKNLPTNPHVPRPTHPREQAGIVRNGTRDGRTLSQEEFNPNVTRNVAPPPASATPVKPKK